MLQIPSDNIPCPIVSLLFDSTAHPDIIIALAAIWVLGTNVSWLTISEDASIPKINEGLETCTIHTTTQTY